MSKEAMKLALEALELHGKQYPHMVKGYCLDAITAIKEALAQPEQEPVAWMCEGWGPDCGPYIEFYRDDEMGWRDRKEWTALYTSPPAQRTWVNATTWRGLTDEEIDRLWSQSLADTKSETWLPLREFARAIEAKIKEKNQ